METTKPRWTAGRIASTVLSFGLNLAIERLGLNPRYRYAVWAVIAANELRGAWVVYEIGGASLRAVGGF
jgi:hypothetical protein